MTRLGYLVRRAYLSVLLIGCPACGGDDGSANCGNEVLDEGEPCDGDLLGGQTCTDRGFVSGTLACKSDCTFDESNCSDCETCRASDEDPCGRTASCKCAGSMEFIQFNYCVDGCCNTGLSLEEACDVACS